jgi:hypothetical protein
MQDDFPSAGAPPLETIGATIFHIIYYNRFVTRRELLVGGAASASILWARSRWDRTRISAITDEIAGNPDDAVAFAHEHGLQFVEIRNQPGTNKEYAAIREADIMADAAHFVNENVKVSCVNTSLLKFNWPESQPAQTAPPEPGQGEKRLASEKTRWDNRMDDLRKALRCAQIMGADKVRIFAGSRAADPSTALQRTADTIGEMALEAEKQKISLLLENDAATNVATCAELAAVMKLLPSKWVGINWKPAGGGYALLPKKRILNVHAQGLSLNPGTPESEDWKAILLALDHDGYSGRIGLEMGVFDSTRAAAAQAALDQLVHIVREVS